MLKRSLAAIESVLDRTESWYKWRYNRWDHLRLVPYRGYGTAEELSVQGRVLDDRHIPEPHPDQPVWKNALHMLRRIETDEVPGARVRLRFQGQAHEATADEDGFFDIRLAPAEPLPTDRLWHEGAADLLQPPPDSPDDTGHPVFFLVPPPDADFVVVSDVDDTVVRTGATSKLQMTRVVMLNNAHTRIPFPGIGTLYQALQRGPDGEPRNPVFYLSSSPWNYYGLFQRFFEEHGLPTGPLFLKNYGLSEKNFLKTGHRSHKADHIRRLMDTYPDLGFVLIGDSGQDDPEIYHEVARERPDRVRAVFVRDVTPPERDAEVRALAREVEAAGVPMHLVESSAEAAERAAELGLIRPDDVEAVRQERASEEHARQEPGLFARLLEGASDTSLYAALGGALAAVGGLAYWLLRR